MGSLIVFALVLFAGGFLSARAMLRDRHGPAVGRGRRRVQGAARTVVLFALGAQFLLVAFEVQSLIAALTAPLLLGLGVMTWLVCDVSSRFIARHGGLTLHGTLGAVSRERFSEWREWMRTIGSVLVPRDWSEIDLRRLAPEAVLSFRTSASVYALFVVTVPVLVMLAFVATMHLEGTAGSVGVSVWVSFNALLIASCLAVTAITTVALVAVFHVIRVLRVEVSYRRALTTLATVIGLCSAMGALAGALLPVMATTTGLQEMFTPASVARLTSSAVLLEMSAGGAVLGFALGLVVALNDLCSAAENFVLRRLAVPVVFLALLWAGPQFGISPRAVGERILGSYRDMHGDSGPACDDPAPPSLLADQGRMLEVIDRCTGLPILSDWWMWGIACALCAALVLVRTRRDVLTPPTGTA